MERIGGPVNRNIKCLSSYSWNRLVLPLIHPSVTFFTHLTHTIVLCVSVQNGMEVNEVADEDGPLDGWRGGPLDGRRGG